MSETTSKTPRTDAALEEIVVAVKATSPHQVLQLDLEKCKDYVSASFARQLETELSEARAEVKKAKQYSRECCDEHAPVLFKPEMQERSRFNPELVDEALCPVCKALFKVELEKNENKALQSRLTRLEVVAKELAESKSCLNCPDKGWYMIGPVENPQQQQCQWCNGNPKSRFNALTAYNDYERTKK